MYATVTDGLTTLLGNDVLLSDAQCDSQHRLSETHRNIGCLATLEAEILAVRGEWGVMDEIWGLILRLGIFEVNEKLFFF